MALMPRWASKNIWRYRNRGSGLKFGSLRAEAKGSDMTQAFSPVPRVSASHVRRTGIQPVSGYQRWTGNKPPLGVTRELNVAVMELSPELAVEGTIKLI
jgi:hypothetical protein